MILTVEVRQGDITAALANRQGGEEAIRRALVGGYACAGWEWICLRTQVNHHSREGEVKRAKLPIEAQQFIRRFGEASKAFSFEIDMEMPAGFKVGEK